MTGKKGKAGVERQRILVVGPQPPPSGGIATVVCNQMTLRFESPTEMFLFNRATVKKPSGIAFRLAQSVTGRMGPFGLWGISTLWILRAFDRRVEETRPDIVHIHIAQGYEFWLAGLLVLLARRRGRGTVLHTARGGALLHPARCCTVLHAARCGTVLHAARRSAMLHPTRGRTLLHAASGALPHHSAHALPTHHATHGAHARVR